ncbi:unnamed protein product [Adineta ricciae]|uniref:VCBS repeat-containing protein n=2 Tax=Adineta ricciae TaxID=249248 RepID=A0A815G796_ADIRI|nr:unnamed protein product [Adineta ricciae]
MDKNNQSDIIVANRRNNYINVFLGSGTGTFGSYRLSFNKYNLTSEAVGDFNNDSNMDIVVGRDTSNNLDVYFGYSNGVFANQTTYSTDGPASFIVVNDVNHDNQLDIVATTANNTVNVFLCSNNGKFANATIFAVGNLPQSLAITDFNRDQHMDIITTNTGSNDISVLLGDGTGWFRPQQRYKTGSTPFSVAAADFNNDDLPDVIVSNPGENNIMVLLGTTNKNFDRKTTLTTGQGSRPRSLVVADLNNDGQMDIGSANSGTDCISIFFGSGSMTFTNQSIYSTGADSSPYSIAAGDFDRNNQSDMVVANYKSDTIGIFLGYNNGSFTNQTTYSTGSSSSPYFVTVGLFNNDSILDIVVANYGNNKLGVFVGHGDGTFEDMIPLPMEYGSHPFSVVTGDFNNDKKVDFAVGNNGTDSLTILLRTC